MLPVSIVQKKRDKRSKQSRLPKKPRFEPKVTIAAGDHPIIFTKASELK